MGVGSLLLAIIMMALALISAFALDNPTASAVYWVATALFFLTHEMERIADKTGDSK